MIVYVVNMKRYGGRETHSYVIGVFTDETKAREAAQAEEYYRGGKYKPEILIFTLDAIDKDPFEYWLNDCDGDRQGIYDIPITDLTKQ